MLVSILDQIREEARGHNIANKYLAPSGDLEHVNQARARAFIHLYLMVSFGLLGFNERERIITDKGYDGGIDAYYIDNEHRLIYLIQSKFRTTDRNFSEKNISLEEIVAMDVNRILEGNDTDENGNEYNGKIKQLIREVSQIDNIGRYHYKVILLANIAQFTPGQMRKLFDGHQVEVFDHERCYNDLVFPVVSGTYFNASELHIFLDLSNKNAGSKISYEVKTEQGECEITVLFVPTIEIARTLSKYKHAILKHNPRSYLELEGKKVNTAIRETIEKKDTNEFALFNNGITMISDSTGISERIGQRNKAQLAVRNPQIINGGQTAYTLSKMYDSVDEEIAIKLFEGKEVLLKVITLIDATQTPTEEKLKLIDAISTATNQQTIVIDSDRISNEPTYEKLQERLYSRYGIFFEKKRGEFGDGLEKGYIQKGQILERNLFCRIYLATQGHINKSIGRRIFLKFEMTEEILIDNERLDQFYFAYLCYQILDENRGVNKKKDKEFYSFLYVLSQLHRPNQLKDYAAAIKTSIDSLNLEWIQFHSYHSKNDTRFIREFIDKESGEKRNSFNASAWYKNFSYENDVKIYFGIGDLIQDEAKVSDAQDQTATITAPVDQQSHSGILQ